MNDDPPPLPANVKKRKGEKFLFWFLILCIAIIFIYCAMDLSSFLTWKHFESQMKARGESLDFADFIPKPVPDSQNFALTPIVASSYSGYLDPHGNLLLPPNEEVSNRLDMRIYADISLIQNPTNYLYSGWEKGKKADLQAQQLYYRALASDEFGSNIFPIPSQPGSPAQDVLLALSKYNSQVEELRKASELPYSRFPLNYAEKNPFDGKSAPIPDLDFCIIMLELRSLAETSNNQTDNAISDLKLSFRLVNSIHSDPYFYTQIDRSMMFQNAMQPVWEGLNKHVWSDNQLVDLDNELKKFDFLTDYELAVRADRAEEIHLIEYLRRTKRLSYIFEPVDMASQVPPDSGMMKDMAYHLMPDSIFYQTETIVGKYYQNYLLPIVDLDNQTVSPDAASAAVDESDNLDRQNILAFHFLPDLASRSKDFAFAQNSINMARIACALECYRLAHANYPQTLDSLAPQFIDKIPHDVINGQPLKYHPTDDGKYVLYSVGWNKMDDGGRVGMINEKHYDYRVGDWIWNGTGVTNEMLNP
jgi:hypothetical protein